MTNNSQNPHILTLPASPVTNLNKDTPGLPETASEFFKSIAQYEEGINVDFDDTERETLVRILKELILNLPLDPECGEECYRSDSPAESGKFRLTLYGYEMRALRTLLQKIQ